MGVSGALGAHGPEECRLPVRGKKYLDWPRLRLPSKIARYRSSSVRTSAAVLATTSSAAAAARRCRMDTQMGTLAAGRQPELTGNQTRARRSSWALMATTTVLADISTAPIAGDKTNPYPASKPAASGIATML